MESIGTILRHEREQRGLSVQQVFESTRITVPNVEALEHDHFESFPNKVYARAFLRDYANFLGVDSAMLLQRYESEWCSVSIVEPLPVVPVKRTGNSMLSWGSMIILILLLAGGGYYWFAFYASDAIKQSISSSVQELFGNGPTTQDETLNLAQSPVSSPVPPVVDTPPVNPKPTMPAVLPAIPAVNTGPIKPVTPPSAAPQVTPAVSGLVLTVSALQDVWIRVVGDGKILFQQNMRSGQSKSWTAGHTFKVRSGMLHAVQIKLNGVPKKLKPASRSRVPIGIADFGLKDIAAVSDAP